jgi:hypothetical protein
MRVFQASAILRALADLKAISQERTVSASLESSQSPCDLRYSDCQGLR